MSSQKPADFNRIAYNLWSKQYDQEANSTIAVDEAHFPKLWKHLRGKSVLEIGSGTGRHTIRLLEANNRVVAVEPSEGMMKVARSKITGGEIQFIQADFLTESKLSNDAFDAVIVSLVLEHIEDLNSFFRKAAGHLKSGGRLYVSEIHPERIAGGSQAHFSDPSTGEDIQLASYAHSDSEVRKAAAAAGFILAETRDIFGDAELSRLQPKWSKHLGKPMIKIWAYAKP